MEVIAIIKLILRLVISIVIGLVLANLKLGDVKNKAKDKYSEYKQKDKDKREENIDKKLEYDDVDAMLTSRGVKWRMGDSFSPFDYTMFRLLCAVGIGALSMVLHPMAFVPGVFVGYWFMGWYFAHKDKYDNGEMMEDISQLFSIVSLQLRNNVFIKDVIYECYLCVHHPRLKKALLELSLEIGQFSDIKTSADNFRKKFNNEHLDMFAKTLEQIQDSGNAIHLFEDLERQIKSINEANAIRAEKKIDDVCSIFMILVFISAILFVAYIMITMLDSSVFIM